MSIICIIEMFEMMATLAIGGLDSTKLQDVRRRREREREGGREEEEEGEQGNKSEKKERKKRTKGEI